MMIDIQDIRSKTTLPAIGIDLGTTHTVVSLKTKNHLEIIDIDGNNLIPSVIAKTNDGQFIIGQEAFLFDQAIHSVKRHMANPLVEIGYGHSAFDLTSEFLRQIRHRLEKKLNYTVRDVVITVPAYFDDTARQATKDAAFLAGFNVKRLLNEPTAAALSYGIDRQKEGLYLVYDLGGGTFDVSLLHMREGIFHVLATGGHTTLGGDDIDLKILNDLNWQKNTTNLLKARELKHRISKNHEDTDFLTKGQLLTLSCSLIQTTLKICDQVIKDAKIELAAICGIVLCGGSTRLLGLKEALKEHYKRPLFDDIDPDLCVAKGAALQAFALQQGEGALLLDVTPLSLGIETIGGLFEKIIDRNTAIPVQKAQDFTTSKDGQTSLKIHVLQGEREMAKDCRSLCTFIFSNIPPLPSGAARIRITFSLDVDGVLSVKAKEMHTNLEQTVSVEPSYGLTPENVLKMLYESHRFAKDDLQDRLLQESTIQTKHLISIIQKAIIEDDALLTDVEREKINHLLYETQNAIIKKERESIEELKKKLSQETQAFAERRLEKAIQDKLLGQHTEKIDS